MRNAHPVPGTRNPEPGSFLAYHARTLGRDVFDVEQLAALDAGFEELNVVGALALGFVHQFVRALNELVRNAPRAPAPFGDAAEAQADHADVDAHRTCGEAMIFDRPVVALNGFAESLGDR